MLINIELVVYILSGVIIALVAWIAYLEYRLKKLLRGQAGMSLESLIGDLGKQVDFFHDRHGKLDKYLENIENRVRGSVQHVRTVRFNPFSDKGGNQSFATALLDQEGNGVVISTLASREKVNVFAKPIENYDSEYELTDEEKLAIAKASNNG